METQPGARIAGGDLAGEHMDGLAQRERAGDDGAGALAAERGGVEAALAGEHDVGRGNAGLEVQPGGDEFEAGQQTCADGRHQPERDAPGRARAGLVHQRVRLVAVRTEQQAEPRAGVIEFWEVGRLESLLRSIHGRCAASAEQRVGHIAGDANGRQRNGQFAGDAFDLVPARRAGRADVVAVMRNELETEGGQRAESEVVRGAPTDAKENGSRACLCGGGEQLAGAESGGFPRVTLVGREECEPAGGGHFDDGDFGVVGKR